MTDELLAKYQRLQHRVEAFREARETFDKITTNSHTYSEANDAMIKLWERRDQMYEALELLQEARGRIEA